MNLSGIHMHGFKSLNDSALALAYQPSTPTRRVIDFECKDDGVTALHTLLVRDVSWIAPRMVGGDDPVAMVYRTERTVVLRHTGCRASKLNLYRGKVPLSRAEVAKEVADIVLQWVENGTVHGISPGNTYLSGLLHVKDNEYVPRLCA